MLQGCLAPPATAPRATKWSPPSRWWWEPGPTSIIWSASPASSAATGERPVCSPGWLSPVRFCVGDQFYLYENKILCGPDYEERMLFANLHNHPDRLAQIKNHTRLLPPPSQAPFTPPSSSSTSGPACSSSQQGYGYPPYPPASPGAPLPKCGNLHPLPPISSVKSLSKRTALAIWSLSWEDFTTNILDEINI